jgi:hypothetical protein
MPVPINSLGPVGLQQILCHDEYLTEHHQSTHERNHQGCFPTIPAALFRDPGSGWVRNDKPASPGTY